MAVQAWERMQDFEVRDELFGKGYGYLRGTHDVVRESILQLEFWEERGNILDVRGEASLRRWTLLDC